MSQQKGEERRDDAQAEAADRFELPLPDEEAKPPRMRRRPFGLRARDVREEIASKDGEIAELRRDVAALWLAFGQHERTIRDLLDTVERMGGGSVPPPGSRSGPPAPAPEGSSAPASPAHQHDPPAAAGAYAERSPAPEPEAIAAQLSELDSALAAIERATRSLSRDEEADPDPTGGQSSPDPQTAGDSDASDSPPGDDSPEDDADPGPGPGSDRESA